MTDEEKKVLAEMLGGVVHNGKLYVITKVGETTCEGCSFIKGAYCQADFEPSCTLTTVYKELNHVLAE